MKKQTLKLKKNHGWRCRPGYRILVLDRGAVRFDVPAGWVLKMDPVSVKLFDGEPPDDDCRLEVSFNRLPPADWSGFPLEQALRGSIAGDPRGLTETGAAVTINRHDLRLVWFETAFDDPAEHRPARSRFLLAIGNNVQCLITLDFWEADAARLTPVWDELVRTLRLGLLIADPTTGAAVNPTYQ